MCPVGQESPDVLLICIGQSALTIMCTVYFPSGVKNRKDMEAQMVQRRTAEFLGTVVQIWKIWKILRCLLAGNQQN